MTLTELTTRVSNYLEDPDNIQWSTLLIEGYLNDAARDFSRTTKVLHRRAGVTVANPDGEPEWAAYALPDDFHELESVWYRGRYIEPVNLRVMPDRWEMDTVDKSVGPTGYLLGDYEPESGVSIIRFWPYSTSVYDDGDLVIFYTALAGAMTTPYATPFGIPVSYQVALAYYAVAACYRRNFEERAQARAGEFQALYQREVTDCLARVGRRFNSTPVVGPYRYL